MRHLNPRQVFVKLCSLEKRSIIAYDIGGSTCSAVAALCCGAEHENGEGATQAPMRYMRFGDLANHYINLLENWLYLGIS